jgi:adenosine deaminase
VELHVHLEGAIPHEALFELIEKYGGDPSVPDVAALAGCFEYSDFPHFIAAWNWKNRYLREYEDFTLIAQLAAHDLAQQGVRYAEVFYSPASFADRGLSVHGVTRAVRAGLSKVRAIEVALICDLVRDEGPEAGLVTLRQLREVKELGVAGIGIGGSEQRFPPAPFMRVFEEARAMGFRTTAHAGEAAGPGSIWGAIRELEVDRIGHGTTAWQDPRLVEYLIEHRIPLEMCPVSNVRTNVVESIREHPIRHCFDAGVLVTVNTDDPKMFQTSLAGEYRLLEQECGWTKPEICRLVLNGVESSWLPDDRKLSLAAELRSSPYWRR